MARIRRAQAKGKKDVKLSQEELRAIERQRQRMQNGGEKKRKEQRFAVPLSHLEPTSRKRIDAGPSGTENSPPLQQAPNPDEAQHQQHRGHPPMGYFPPPSASRPPRPRSGTNSRPSSRNAVDREQSSSPFSYTYVQRGDHAASLRHSSDPATGQPRSRGSIYAEPGPMDGAVGSYPPPGPPGQFDPFQYMTGGSRTSYPVATSSPATRQSVSNSPRTSVPSPRTQPPPGPSAAAVNTSQGRRVSNRTEESSSEEETSSEEEDDDEVVVVSAKRTSPVEQPGARIVTAAPPAPVPGPVTRERERREAEIDGRRLSREQSPPIQSLRRSPTKQGSGSSSRKTGGGITSSSSRRRKK